jgi:Leucine-rich repeat (LRR) protein
VRPPGVSAAESETESASTSGGVSISVLSFLCPFLKLLGFSVLTNLWTLDLSFNQISDVIPLSLTSLPSHRRRPRYQCSIGVA